MTCLRTQLHEHSRPKGFFALAQFLLAGLLATAAGAQSPAGEVGGAAAYQPAKTIDDYTRSQADGADDFDYATNTLRVEVWTDRASDEIYRKGEKLGVSFEVNRDAYAVVYRIDADGVVEVLWPRSRFDDGFVFGGHEYALPVTGARELKVSANEGQGLVEAVVSRYPFDLRALEIDFHHEQAAERYDFRVAGDPFLAMNEVNFAVTGLEDSGEFVVTNYASYYVHQAVEHPRYLCNQCHVNDDVAYDPYRDECTLTIEYDYSWYNGWYDRYGYYPVYGNPVYVYLDPWTWSPWVNYWYRPYYRCAPWYGWGWGWSACYDWSYSPYYYGDCVTVYNSGHRRYRPLDRTRLEMRDGVATKTREYQRGSAMVRSREVPDSKRDAMRSRTRVDVARGDVSGRTVADTRYRGEAPSTRTRRDFDRTAADGRGGLRIRENVRTGAGTRVVGDDRRHTAAGEGRRAGLVPVSRDDTWRGTTRVGGRSAAGGGIDAGSSVVGNGRSGAASSGTVNTRSASGSRGGGDSKSVQPRTRSTRVWNTNRGRDESTRSRTDNSRGRGEATGDNDSRSRAGSRETVKPRSDGGSSRKSSDAGVRSNSGSRERSGGSSNSSSGSRSGGSRSGGSRGGRDTGRR